MRADATSPTPIHELAFTKRVIAPMAGMITLSIALVLGFVFYSAFEQNRLEVEASSKLAATALDVNKRQLGRNLRDYAVWEDVYRNLHLTVDFVWAATDGNVGANIYEGLLYEMAFVVAPNGETVYSVIEGVPQVSDVSAYFPDGLQELIASGLAEAAPAVDLLRSEDDIYLVAATAILPPSINRASLPISSRSALVFAKKLDQEFLTRMSGEYLLRNLEIIPDDRNSTGSILLSGSDGTSVGYLSWLPQQPGYELLRLLLPPLVIAILVLAAAAWLVIGNARRSALALEESAQTLQESEARFRDVAEASSDWIWECDPNGRVVYLSTRFSDVTGIAATSLLGRTLDQFFAFETKPDDWTRLFGAKSEVSSFRDVRCSYADAVRRNRISRLAGRPIMSPSGVLSGYRGTATDITEEVEAQERATHLALHDALTQLPNRVLFSDRLRVALQGNWRGSHGPECISVLCLDLDHFKEVNDTLGHGAGDQLLKQLADRLRACLRPEDTVARLGGDEFAIIQVDADQPVQAEALSDRINGIVKQPFLVEGQELYVGVSIGVALSSGPDESPERLLKNADIALYRAKHAGRGTTRFFATAMDDELRARKAIEYDLRQALTRNEMEVYYQPIVHLDTEDVIAVEALVRWRHPRRGLVGPAEFIPIAEETGLITTLGEWVLRTACAEAKSWPGVQIAVNLSTVQFRNQELIGIVQDVLMVTELDPNRLELEITESVLIKDAVAALAILTQLKRLGVRIAMDDFGTGYSSLGYLNAFPFDKIKIDRSFISNLQDEEKSSAIVRSIISLGASLAMTTTAEGVETMEQAAFLRQEGCEQVQGYFFGRPMQADDITRLLPRLRVGRRSNPSLDAA